jgi:hypothetical protein
MLQKIQALIGFGLKKRMFWTSINDQQNEKSALSIKVRFFCWTYLKG